ELDVNVREIGLLPVVRHFEALDVDTPEASISELPSFGVVEAADLEGLALGDLHSAVRSTRLRLLGLDRLADLVGRPDDTGTARCEATTAEDQHHEAYDEDPLPGAALLRRGCCGRLRPGRTDVVRPGLAVVVPLLTIWLGEPPGTAHCLPPPLYLNA